MTRRAWSLVAVATGFAAAIVFGLGTAHAGPWPYQQIWVMNADGSGQFAVTHASWDNAYPDWSPDGTKIAFDRPDNSGLQIYVMNADGSGHVNLSSYSN